MKRKNNSKPIITCLLITKRTSRNLLDKNTLNSYDFFIAPCGHVHDSFKCCSRIWHMYIALCGACISVFISTKNKSCFLFSRKQNYLFVDYNFVFNMFERRASPTHILIRAKSARVPNSSAPIDR